MHFAKNKLLNTAALKLALQGGEAPIPLFKTTIKNALSQLALHQLEGVSSAELIDKYTWMIDKLVVMAWKRQIETLPVSGAIELVAVGGYGRGELHPHSDVDLLILLRDNQYDLAQEFIEAFLRFLWDIGLEIGHSVRSVKDCLKEAKQDITVMTNLLEGRHLVGSKSLFAGLDEKLRSGRIWSPDKFYTGKFEETGETPRQVSGHSLFARAKHQREPRRFTRFANNSLGLQPSFWCAFLSGNE